MNKPKKEKNVDILTSVKHSAKFLTKKLFIMTIISMAAIFIIQTSSISADAATRVYWYKKMNSGGSIRYLVDPNVRYTTLIRNAEIEIEIPAAGFTNPMKLSKTTTKSLSKMDFYQTSNPNSIVVAATYSYRAGSSSPMKVVDKDVYNWNWCKIVLNPDVMNKLTTAKRQTAIVHEMLHAYGGKDTYSSDQKGSIMYGDILYGTAKGVTRDANNFLNNKY